MNKQHAPDVQIFNAAQYSKLNAIGQEALTEIGTKYGSGFPDYFGGEDGGLGNHNWHHTDFVRAGSVAMGVAFQMPAAERALTEVTAEVHDVVQLKARGEMERESADWLVDRLRSSGLFEKDHIESVELGVLGTEPIFADGTLTQVALYQEYPSKSAENLAMSVACADLGEAFTATGPLTAHDLFKEMNGIKPQEEPPFEKLLDFQRKQVTLLDNYRFPHPLGEQVFGGLRKEIIDYTTTLVLGIEAGDIENWAQVVEADLAFMRQHR
jgi:hypothetical protein